MLQSSYRRHYTHAKHRLLSFAATLILATLSSACSDRETSSTEALSGSASKPTSRDLFVNDCASCHGVDGSGNGPLAADLKVAPTNLRLLKQSNDGDFPSLDVQRAIDGRGTARAHGLPDMPVWGRRWILEGLNDAERKARVISITSYIATIQD